LSRLLKIADPEKSKVKKKTQDDLTIIYKRVDHERKLNMKDPRLQEFNIISKTKFYSKTKKKVNKEAKLKIRRYDPTKLFERKSQIT